MNSDMSASTETAGSYTAIFNAHAKRPVVTVMTYDAAALSADAVH